MGGNRTMTQEEKDLLLKDLCAMLPYGVKIQYDIYGIQDLTIDKLNAYIKGRKNIKPYLRPLTSLTDDELKYLDDLGMKIAPFSQVMEIPFCKISDLIDFFYANHLDYRGTFLNGLIDQDLAISTEIHNPYKE